MSKWTLKLEVGNWEMEPGNWAMERGSQKMETRRQDARIKCSKTGIRSVSGQYPEPDPAMEAALNTSAGGSLGRIY